MDYNTEDMGDMSNWIRALDAPAEDLRPGYPDERACYNCSSHDSCWLAGFWQEEAHTPVDFARRPEWSSLRLSNHMKNVIGQICQHFEHADRRSRLHHEESQAKKDAYAQKKEQKDSGWDMEENI